MTNFYVTYTAPNKEARDGFMEELKALKITEKCEAEDGCIRYRYFIPVDSDVEIWLWEQWETRDAQKVHMTQPHLADIGKAKEKYNMEARILIEDAAF